jgi:hypothetical protein
MQPRPGRRAQSGDIPGVRWNLRFPQRDVQHEKVER